jgi:phosphoenolpyruvate carboxylase
MSEPTTVPAAPGDPSGTSKICSVDSATVERFLILIRDNYPKADRASFFLEEVAGKTSSVAMANLRDVLSHLATALSSDTRPEDLDAQLASAEEHFRRAIQEPYAIALGNLREKFNTVHEEYRKIYPKIVQLKKEGFVRKCAER